MTVIYNMSIDRADKPWIGDRRFTESLFTEPSAERRERKPDDAAAWWSTPSDP